MLLRPSSFSCQAPAVDNVSIKDELFAVCVLEKVIHFVDLAIECPEVHIGEKDRLE